MSYIQIVDMETEIEIEPYGAGVEVTTRCQDVVLRYELTLGEVAILINNFTDAVWEVNEG
jgi:hypothetical protein